jgi:uncharacterized membrane protein YphA (DoxX/SURF4 family)
MRQRLAVVFLVLLRMAIGWHFLFEGMEKYDSIKLWGATDSRKPWTSETYFREAAGPMGALVRRQIGGDLDDLALARLTVRNESGTFPRLPDGLDQEWDDYFIRFVAHYGLDERQQAAARERLAREKEKSVVWFTAKDRPILWLMTGQLADYELKPFKHSYPTGSFDVKMSVSERVDEYRAKVQESRALPAESAALGHEVARARRAATRAEAVALRAELLALVDRRTEGMKQSLSRVLTAEQGQKGPVPESKKETFINFIDQATMWFLITVGACLLLGLFSRLSAFCGALFLLMTVLTVPSLPWLPPPPNSEGHYFIVSKNVIEMLALLMLTFIPSGRWFGLDAFIHALNPWAKRDVDAL